MHSDTVIAFVGLDMFIIPLVFPPDVYAMCELVN